MDVRELKTDEIGSIVPLYLAQYNGQEGGCWTEHTAQKRIRQIVTMEDAYSLLLMRDGEPLGFAVGFFRQYDDIVGYYLDEIVVAPEHQNRGLGSLLLNELEQRVRAKGASIIELQSVAGEKHEHFYSKSGFYDAKNFVLKAKWLEE